MVKCTTRPTTREERRKGSPTLGAMKDEKSDGTSLSCVNTYALPYHIEHFRISQIGNYLFRKYLQGVLAKKNNKIEKISFFQI